jgi:hypothetical protein
MDAQTIPSKYEKTRRDLRDLAHFVSESMREQGAHQEVKTLSVRFDANGSMFARVTSETRLYIKYDM